VDNKVIIIIIKFINALGLIKSYACGCDQIQLILKIILAFLLMILLCSFKTPRKKKVEFFDR